MNRTLRLLMVSALLFLAALPALAENQALVSAEDFAQKRRPQALFDHELHEGFLNCERCHHDYDQYGNNTDPDGRNCNECHTVIPGNNPVSLEDAFHGKCKTCHETMNAKKAAQPPVLCGQCHKRR